MTNVPVAPPKNHFFTEKELEFLDRTKIPQHVAIIPDGNRRWAKRQSKESLEGHRYGADAILDIVEAAKEIGIKTLTVYSFSTENWKRSQPEVSALMRIFEDYLANNLYKLMDNSIRFNYIGNISSFPESLKTLIESTKEHTKNNSEFDLVLAFNYGGRDELLRATKKMLLDCEKGILSSRMLSEQIFSSYLDTNSFSDPDFIIRTSGEQRLSNFLLWQSAYSELYIENDLWPQFSPRHLLKAIIDYQQRDRRRGGGAA